MTSLAELVRGNLHAPFPTNGLDRHLHALARKPSGDLLGFELRGGREKDADRVRARREVVGDFKRLKRPSRVDAVLELVALFVVAATDRAVMLRFTDQLAVLCFVERIRL